MSTDTPKGSFEARGPNLDLERFAALVRSRRSTRHFRPDPVPDDLLDQLLDVARWAPSGFNLQPTHFVVVTDHAVKALLYPACMKQRQVLEAGATVVFTGDRDAYHNNFEQVLELDREAEAIDPAYEKLLRWAVPLFFSTGPVGLGWLWKAVGEAVANRVVPIPSMQAVHREYWLAKQVCLAAMAFMLAAESAGLHTCPMEGFGEPQVRSVLGIPSRQLVVVCVAVGYADNSQLKKTRLPLEGMVHRNKW